MRWITKFLYLQVIWVFASLLGLIAGGLFPATISMFAIVRKWIREDADFPIWHTFMTVYKSTFVKSNLLGYFLSLFAFSIYYYYTLTAEVSGLYSLIIITLLLLTSLLFLMTILFVIPVYVHFDVGMMRVVYYALATAFTYPFHFLLMALTVLIFIFTAMLLPAVVLCIGISLLSYLLMFIANKVFIKMDEQVKGA
jgi:uncharacterized membrane protein YesL